MTKLFLCGAGNPEGVRLALAVNERTQRWSEICLVDDDEAKHGMCVLGVDVVGGFDKLADSDPATEAINLVARSTKGRANCRERILSFSVSLVPLIHPTVDVFGVDLEGDVTVYANAVVSAGARVGAGTVVFTGAVVGHGSVVGRGCVFAPGAVTNARVIVEDLAYLGANASVLPELRIGAGATVAAGSAVMVDVRSGVTVLGVPAQPLGKSGASQPQLPTSPPAAALLATITAIWRDLLEIPEVGLHDNFFEVGGTSRLALDVALRVQEATDVPLTITDIFRFTSISELASYIEGGSGNHSRGRDRAQARRARRSA